MKKLFGGINLTIPKVLIMGLIIGIYTGCSLLIPLTRHTSFSDLGATFEVWIFFGIFIIMNSKSAKDAAIKCFLFFLVSQPVIYLVQDLVEHQNLFATYYSTWFIWTLLCIPMGFIGYYMKKDKWWGLLILVPMLGLLAIQYEYYLNSVLFSFPKHLLTVLFCIACFIIYPLYIFNNKKVRIAGLIISVLILIAATVLGLQNKPVYSTEIMFSGNTYQFDDTCTITMEDDSVGKLSIIRIDNIDDFSIHADFVKEGHTTFELACPNTETIKFDLTVKSHTYDLNEIKY